jgi:hypothetical protein
MGEVGRTEVAEMIRCWGGDEGATLVAARRTTTLGRYSLELNFNKWEIFCYSGGTDLKIIKEFQNLARGIKICDRGSFSFRLSNL